MQPMRLLRLALSCALLALPLSGYANWQSQMPSATLQGEGQMKWLGFKLYNAKLWRPAETNPAQLSQFSEPFALELTYQRSISREALVEASLKEIRRLSAQPLSRQQLGSWQQAMEQAFVDVRAGDQITGLYVPGQGARFYLGQQLTHAINDEAFAQAFFNIWLDPRTRNPELRQQLLGQ